MTSVAIDRPAGTGGEAGTPPGDRRFRPDVQGMRAIAILLAIVYHAGLAGFHGGYVGIEVFFVISGFVITGLLPVSYTHLDVYKRQAPQRRIDPKLR